MLEVLAGGKLLLGGEAEDGAFLARYDGSGAPDRSFGDAGLIRNALAGHPAFTGGMVGARQPDGKLVVTGNGISVSRLGADGRLDPSFGQGGTAPMRDTDGFYWGDRPSVLALQPDGRILVAGSSGPGAGYAFTVARLHADGSRDTSWSIPRTRFPSASWPYEAGGVVRELFLEPDGRVLAVGDSHAVRYRSDGTLDETFGTNGRVTFLHTADGVVGAFIGADGELLSVGTGSSATVTNGLALTVNRIPVVGRYHALAPSRILDTRVGVGRAVGTVGPGSGIYLQVTGRAGVPSRGVSAVVANLTATEPSTSTFVTAYPTGSNARPHASNLNVVASQTRANLVTVGVGPDGGIVLYNSAGTVHLVVDVAGWYGDGTEPGGTRFHPLTPARVLDTRTGNGAPVARLGPGSTLDLQATGRGGVPAGGVSAVVMNLTAVSPSWGGYLTAWPAGQSRPLASNLNLAAGQTTPNLAIVAVGAGGRVSLFNAEGTVELVADVAGWYGDGTEPGSTRFHPSTPARILDTRTGGGAPSATALAPGAVLELQATGRGGVPSADVVAVVMNVTVTQPTAASHLTVWPSGQGRPFASSLNFAPGETVANLVTVPVGAGGRISIYNGGGSTHVLSDVAGWYGG